MQKVIYFFVSCIILIIIQMEVDHPSYKAVLDRFATEDKAVLLVEELNKEFIIPAEDLPPGSDVSMWFDVEVDGEQLRIDSMNWLFTEQEWEKARELVEKVRR